MDEIDIYLKNHPSPESRAYLSEGEFQLRFSLLQKVYYLAARPLIPVGARHWLQRRYTDRIECRAQFICDDLVELLKSDEVVWHDFVRTLYPQPYETAILITHDVETQKGYDFIPKVIELERAYGFRGSWNVVAHKYRLHAEITDFIRATGNEIGIHGYNHDGTDYYSERRFLQRAVYVNEALRRFGAVGFRSPQVHRNLRWLQHLNILYDSSCFDYDPYQPFPGGTGSIWPFMAGKFVELPYTIPQDHVLFYLLKKKDISIWKEKAAWVAANHGMILSLTHPDYLMEGDHLRRYEEWLGYLKEIPQAWHCLPREMANWYMNLAGRYEPGLSGTYSVSNA
jgi:peptidoglycan/xylan/chitin deacetylase (PgdA/CDA1 family)